jgi:hypothetical protein
MPASGHFLNSRVMDKFRVGLAHTCTCSHERESSLHGAALVLHLSKRFHSIRDRLDKHQPQHKFEFHRRAGWR